MPEISAERDLSDSESGGPARSGHAVPSNADVRRHGGGDSGSGDDSGSRTMPEAPAASVQYPEISPSVLQQQRPLTEPPPYEPVLFLSMERYQLHGIKPTDLAADGLERLKEAVWIHTSRHLVGACVRVGRDDTFDVILDVAEVLDGWSGGAGAGGAAGTFSGARRLATVALERRKPALGGGGAAAAGDSRVGNGRPRRYFDAAFWPDVELGMAHLEDALLRRAWWRPRSWARWARGAVAHAVSALADFEESLWTLKPRSRPARASSKGRAGLSAGWGCAAAPRMNDAMAGASALGRVVASRITSVAPRVVLLDRTAANGLGPQGAVAHRQPLAAGSTAPASASLSASCLQVAAAVCCGSPSGLASSNARPGRAVCSGGGKPAGLAGEDGRREACPTASCAGGPLVEVVLRQGHRFTSGQALSGGAQEAGAMHSPSAPKTCRRPQCRQHLVLRQDIRLAAWCNGEAAEARALRLATSTSNWLGPGLLLLEVRADGSYRTSTQRPVPVVVLDDPWVVEELQAAFADKQVLACSGVNFDDLLVDLGVFLQHLADLRSAAAPVLALADAGLLRLRRMPPSCCCQPTNSCGKHSSRAADGGPAVPGARVIPAECMPGCGQEASAGYGPGKHGAQGAASAAAASVLYASTAATPAPVCVLCDLRRLHDVLLGQYLSTSLCMLLGERLLRHATASGWFRTASHISTCLIDLQRIDVLAEAVLGRQHGPEDAGARGDFGRDHHPADAAQHTAKHVWDGFERFTYACAVEPIDRSSPAALMTALRMYIRHEFRKHGLRGLLEQMWELDAMEQVAWMMVSYGVQLLLRVLLHAVVRLGLLAGLALPTWLLGRAVMLVYAFLASKLADDLLVRFSAGVRAVRRGTVLPPARVKAGGWRRRAGED